MSLYDIDILWDFNFLFIECSSVQFSVGRFQFHNVVCVRKGAIRVFCEDSDGNPECIYKG